MTAVIYLSLSLSLFPFTRRFCDEWWTKWRKKSKGEIVKWQKKFYGTNYEHRALYVFQVKNHKFNSLFCAQEKVIISFLISRSTRWCTGNEADGSAFLFSFHFLCKLMEHQWNWMANAITNELHQFVCSEWGKHDEHVISPFPDPTAQGTYSCEWLISDRNGVTYEFEFSYVHHHLDDISYKINSTNASTVTSKHETFPALCMSHNHNLHADVDVKMNSAYPS